MLPVKSCLFQATHFCDLAILVSTLMLVFFDWANYFQIVDEKVIHVPIATKLKAIHVFGVIGRKVILRDFIHLNSFWYDQNFNCY